MARFDARQVEERFADAKAERRVSCSPLPDGMAGIWSTHTAADAEAMYARLTELAKGIDDTRSMDQKRADTLRDLVLGRTTAGTPAPGDAGAAPDAPGDRGRDQ